MCVGERPSWKDWEVQGAPLRQGVDHFEEREFSEIAVSRVDAADAVFTHEDRGMGVVQDLKRHGIGRLQMA